MANTHDYSIANDTGSAVRTDLNTLFTEIEAANAGASAPTNTAEGKLWYDTGNNVYKMYDGSAWVAISAKMDAVSAASGGTFTGAVTLPSPVINTGVSGTAILDEDAMGSNSATHLATQQSIKAYVDSAALQTGADAQVLGTGDSPEFAGITVPGIVVNVVFDQFTSGSHSLGAWDYLSNGSRDLNVTPTAKCDNSMYILHANFRVNLSSSTGASLSARFTNNTTAISNEYQYLYNNLGGERRFMQSFVGRWDSSISAGTALSIKLEVYGTGGSPSIEGDGTTLTVTEVAQ
jgi:hypothetical protein